MYFAPSNLKTWLLVCYISGTIGAGHVRRFVCVRMWLICSNRKLYHKKTIILLPWHYTTIFLSYTLWTSSTAQIVHSHIYQGKIHSLADQNVSYTVYKKCSQQIITQKQLEPYYLTEVLRSELYNSYTY